MDRAEIGRAPLIPKNSFFARDQSHGWAYTIVSLKLDFAPQKKGAWPSQSGGAKSTCSRLNGNQRTRQRTKALPPDRRDALSSSPKTQRQSAFGIRVYFRLRGQNMPTYLSLIAVSPRREELARSMLCKIHYDRGNLHRCGIAFHIRKMASIYLSESCIIQCGWIQEIKFRD